MDIESNSSTSAGKVEKRVPLRRMMDLEWMTWHCFLLVMTEDYISVCVCVRGCVCVCVSVCSTY